MAKTIFYVPKLTSARTEYREVTGEDRDFLLNQMLYSVVTIAAMSNDPSRDIKDFLSQYWHKKTVALPQSRVGQNSPESFLGGMLQNMLYSDPPQRDFTAKQMEALERIFVWLAALDPRIEEVQFQIKAF